VEGAAGVRTEFERSAAVSVAKLTSNCSRVGSAAAGNMATTLGAAGSSGWLVYGTIGI